MDKKKIAIADYTYVLPENKIAINPLSERDQSKLLIYKEGEIEDDIYRNISDYLPKNSLLVFNDTKVIPARILFKKDTGAHIELFCLEPFDNNKEAGFSMNQTTSVKWKCMIGGAAKWKNGFLQKELLLDGIKVKVEAELKEKLPDAYVTQFSWSPSHFTFSEILSNAGEVPLPPYIKRRSNENDRSRYQTIYAAHKGSVAAPTSGLHFTNEIFSSLKNKEIQTGFVTLHVGAGTFKPVKAVSIGDHEMHAEWIDVSVTSIELILENLINNIIAVGTTSLRTLESLYWMGLKAFLEPSADIEYLTIKQWDVYDDTLKKQLVTVEIALRSLISWMKKNNKKNLFVKTQIIIVPGYNFKIVRGLITNFHQPNSTLLLLVAAAVKDDWKKIYDHALNNDYRFLSYGDGCLMFLSPTTFL